MGYYKRANIKEKANEEERERLEKEYNKETGFLLVFCVICCYSRNGFLRGIGRERGGGVVGVFGWREKAVHVEKGGEEEEEGNATGKVRVGKDSWRRQFRKG